MIRLTQRDLDALLTFLGDLYAQRRLEAFRAFIVDALPALVPSEATSYNEIDVPRRIVNAILDPPVDALLPGGEQIFRALMHEHPLIRHQQARSDDGVVKISDVITMDAWHRLSLYNDFYRPVRIEHQIAFVLPPHAPVLFGVSLNRGSPDFTERERALLDAARPHVVQAFHNARSLTRIVDRLNAFGRAVEASSIELLVLDDEGRVQAASDGCWSRLWTYFGPRLRIHEPFNRPPEVLRHWVRQQQLALLRQRDDAPSPLVPLTVERDDRRLVVHLVPGQNDGQTLLVLDEQARRTTAAALDQRGLTPRQTEIATLVAKGLTNQEIAWDLSISPLTVRTHLEHIFARLGVRSRTELARLAAPREVWEPVPGTTDPTVIQQHRNILEIGEGPARQPRESRSC